MESTVNKMNDKPKSKGCLNKTTVVILAALISGVCLVIAAVVPIVGQFILKDKTPTPTVYAWEQTPITGEQINFETPIVEIPTEAPTETAMPIPPTATIELIPPTPQPTATAYIPIDSNPPIQLPFSDNFDNGLSPEWRIVAGQPIIVDGYLSSIGDQTVLEIGNTDLQDFSLNFDFKDTYNGVWLGGLKITIGNRVSFVVQGCPIWSVYQDGSWNDATHCKSQISIPGKLRLTVQGNRYQVYINGSLFSEITLGQPVSGPLSISFSNLLLLDNLKVTQP